MIHYNFTIPIIGVNLNPGIRHKIDVKKSSTWINKAQVKD